MVVRRFEGAGPTPQGNGLASLGGPFSPLLISTAFPLLSLCPSWVGLSAQPASLGSLGATVWCGVDLGPAVLFLSPHHQFAMSCLHRGGVIEQPSLSRGALQLCPPAVLSLPPLVVAAKDFSHPMLSNHGDSYHNRTTEQALPGPLQRAFVPLSPGIFPADHKYFLPQKGKKQKS